MSKIVHKLLIEAILGGTSLGLSMLSQSHCILNSGLEALKKYLRKFNLARKYLKVIKVFGNTNLQTITFRLCFKRSECET